MTEDDNSDDLVFASETEPLAPVSKVERASAYHWKVAIIDDDESIHEVTQLALKGFTFGEREIEYLHAYSGEEGKQLLADHSDIAVVFLDVVMENDHAGLDVAKYVREDLENNLVRIILRTGQPGQAPERQVIADYDINDYKEKTELTARKLFTVTYASLRSYRDLITIERNRLGLEQIINSSQDVFELKSLNAFTKGVLEQLTSLLHLDQEAVYCHGLAVRHEGDNFPIVAATGNFADLVGQDVDALDPDIVSDFHDAVTAGNNLYLEDRFVGYFMSNSGIENLLYLSGIDKTSRTDRNLLELFTRNVAIAHENIHLHQDLEETQSEIVYMLGEAVETRSKETGNHVKRVAEISKLLALKLGVGETQAEILKLASPLHDIGKIGIPDAILNKPGRHTPEEFEIMKTHAQLGYDMLKTSKRHVLRAGAIIANEHHERWEGGGYPNNLKGDDIHVFGRISAIADVFDALGSERCYKEAWPIDKVLELIRSERGKQFDPAIVDILLANIDEVVAIKDQFVDVF